MSESIILPAIHSIYNMPAIKRLSFLILMVLLSSAVLPVRMDYRDARYNNVCKDLRGDALLYFIFIDTRETSPWTEFDIISTIDSMGVAIRWLENKAADNNIKLTIKSDYYIGNEYATVNRNLPENTLYESLTKPNLKKGIEALNKWSDDISRRAGESFYIVEKDGIPKIQPPRDTERLIAHLRDEFSVESVALMFMLNNYFRSDISIALNTMISDDVEFAVVSYKYPSLIAHNFLHLYGAADLHKTPFRNSRRKIKLAGELFPSDIMQDPYAKNINELKISDYTKYLIGWKDEIAIEHEPLLTDRIITYR